MSSDAPSDWDPHDPAVQNDQLRAYDDMRRRCPVARSEYHHWSVFRHADVLHIILHPEQFSNVVSTHPSIPNGMDPPEHTAWRALIDPYFAAPLLKAFEPAARSIAHDLVRALPGNGGVEWMAAFADECAVRLLCGYMGWSEELHEPLRLWARRNQAATLAGDRRAMAEIAFEFDGYIRAQLAERRKQPGPLDLTSRLLRETVEGRALLEEEIVSILRNWSVGELSTLSASLGILAEYLARRPELQQQVREQTGLLPAAIDEILRIHPPLISNRRIARQPACLGGRKVEAGSRLTLMWASANRDESVFGDANEFRLDRKPDDNLLYGAGIHVCPGAGLSRLQLRVVMEAVLTATRKIALAAGREPIKARYPAGGFSSLPLQVER